MFVGLAGLYPVTLILFEVESASVSFSESILFLKANCLGYFKIKKSTETTGEKFKNCSGT